MAFRLKILETFRDAIQGLDHVIPTGRKVEALRLLMELGFDYVDAGSFVSPRLIPQFADMDAVLEKIGQPPAGTRLFILAGNAEGARRACMYDHVDVIGFPFSTSETFLRKNINAGPEEGWKRLETVKAICDARGKVLMVYLAMAFGNPYGDPVNPDVCMEFAGRLMEMGIGHIHLSDIIGEATPGQVASYYHSLSNGFPAAEFGIHLHIRDGENAKELLDAAAANGCTTFDGVITGLGGCPMTGYEMLGNLPTSHIIDLAMERGYEVRLDAVRLSDIRQRIMALL